MTKITVSEAFQIASGTAGVPGTLRGFTILGMNHKFIKTEQYTVYRKLYCKKDKLKKYLKYIKTHYTLPYIAKKIGKTPGGINLKVYELNIRGEKNYGKIYYTKKEKNKIINYYKNKKRT